MERDIFLGEEIHTIISVSYTHLDVYKRQGQEVANPVDLEAGTYTVEVSADNYEVFNLNITITADTATHTPVLSLIHI